MLDRRLATSGSRSLIRPDGKAVEAAAGVPFFLEQLVISLLDEQSRGPAPHRRLGGVPLMLAELMSERLDRRPGVRRIAQAAACIGGAFTLDFLLALLEDEVQVHERLEALVEAEILLPKRFGAEIRYEFRHALLLRMAYESMVQTERRAMHVRIVEVLATPLRASRPYRKCSPITLPRRVPIRRRSRRGCGRECGP